MRRARPRALTASGRLLYCAAIIAAISLGSLAWRSALASPPKIVSLDLCSDWLLAHTIKDPGTVVLSPMTRRYPPPWMDQQWPTHDGSLEQILAARPHLVLVGEFNAPILRERLKSLGINTLITRQPTTVHELRVLMRRVNVALAAAGAPRAAIDEAPAEAGSDREPPSSHRADKPDSAGTRGRLLLLGPNGYGTGENTFEADLIRAAGWRNYLETPGHRILDMEKLVSNPPDAVIWAAPSHPALANRFAEHRALTRMLPADRWLKTDYWRWQCPGPWSFDLIRQLRR
jgi:iron complex transport system substrate-binding protein